MWGGLPIRVMVWQDLTEVSRSSFPCRIISDASKGKLKPDVLESFIRSDRLGLRVYWPGKERSSAAAAFKAAMSIGYLEKMPAPGVLYDGP